MVEENLEFYSVIRTVKAIEDSDVCMLMLDATTGLESQDLSILQLALRRSKGIVIVVNKWDLIEKETNTARDFEQVIRQKMAPLRMSLFSSFRYTISNGFIKQLKSHSRSLKTDQGKYLLRS